MLDFFLALLFLLSFVFFNYSGASEYPSYFLLILKYDFCYSLTVDFIILSIFFPKTTLGIASWFPKLYDMLMLIF